MLETKDLYKIYKPKKGAPVTALNGVSLKFPEKGMVFLLGKSGSGKSTLLNILGGLDRYNKGDILIRGVSSKSFKQKSFDSYRNTYVGFIFQEYNILDEFTVGANIALAIQLQNKKATDEQINKILSDVDLEGFGQRKSNELSGGQKQRVAIARALVKNPDIIMADEPTGALDSNTGSQVFDTLKKLSRDKLVIVVSHDREFAEEYADRIIELLDGRVISDVELDTDLDAHSEEKQELKFEGDTISVPHSYHLTEEDRKQINEYIESLDNGLKINISKKTNAAKFKETDQSAISQSTGGFKLIKSRLPMKSAFKIGASGLKHKKIRLVVSIVLCCISFGLFGLADTFGAYNHIETCTNSIVDTGVQYAAVVKSKKVGKGSDSFWRTNSYTFDKKDIELVSKGSGVKMRGVYVPINADSTFIQNINDEIKRTQTDFDIFNPKFNGFSEINKTVIDDFGFKVLAGELPNGAKDEIAVSEYIFEIFKKAGYTDGTTTTVKDNNGVESVKYVYNEIKEYRDLLGKQINIYNKKYTITAIVDTHLDLERYVPLTVEKKRQTNAEQLKDYALFSEFSSAMSNSLSATVLVGEGYIDRLIAERPNIYPMTTGHIYFNSDDSFSVDPTFLSTLDKIDKTKIQWINGEKQQLAPNEIIVTSNVMHPYDGDEVDFLELLKKKNTVTIGGYNNEKDTLIEPEKYNIVGIINIDENYQDYASTIIAADNFVETYSKDGTGVYQFAVGAMPKNRADIKSLVSFCYNDNSNIRYPIQNSVTFQLDMINDTLKALSKYLMYIGIGFALFAALMFSNFIATSISYKKQEIGILRAIGSRSNDVFRIFFSESFIIAMINFVLSAIGVGVVTALINKVFRLDLGILITILNFSIRQIFLLFVVSLLVAFVASYIPVKRIASKRPIDAICDR